MDQPNYQLRTIYIWLSTLFVISRPKGISTVKDNCTDQVDTNA
jgi:hypothetical protein